MRGGAPDDLLLHFARSAFLPDRPDRVAVAVSGGSDSMAALHLLHAAGHSVEAVTVDHGLRPEAATEARHVAETCAGLGVRHTILRWVDGPAATGNLMDHARRARYRLIAAWARNQGLAHVAIAHTADDQAETFLMRLAREAGLDGLSAMRRSWRDDGIGFYRPFVLLTRADLRGYLDRHHIRWIEDPTNTDDRYERSRARKALVQLRPLGITAETLSGVATHLALARQALEAATADAAKVVARLEAGDVVFDRRGLTSQPPEITRRLLVGALRFVSGADYPPRQQALTGLETAMAQGRDRTLAGCRVTNDGPTVRIAREARALRGVACPTTALWDRRWRLTGPHEPALIVRALGADGLKSCPDWRATGLPRATLLASPAVWDGTRLVAAPLAGFPNGWTAELAEGRNSLPEFLMSH